MTDKLPDKIFSYLFKLMGEQTGLILAKYNKDENLINDLYADFLLDLTENETAGIINYLTKLISFLEQKEDYERCANLLKLKIQIKKYND